MINFNLVTLKEFIPKINNLTVFSYDLSGTYHGIHGSPVCLQEKSLEKSIVCQRKNKESPLKIAP